MYDKLRALDPPNFLVTKHVLLRADAKRWLLPEGYKTVFLVSASYNLYIYFIFRIIVRFIAEIK